MSKLFFARIALPLFVMLTTQLVGATELINQAQNEPIEGKWDPLYLYKPNSDLVVNAYKDGFEVQMSSAGYLYSLPAFLHYRQRYQFLANYRLYMGGTENPMGKFLLLRKPPTEKTPDPMPNLDTLYGVTFLDLAVSPMVLEVPPIPDRYFSFALVDAYFYNFDYIGSRTTGQKGGKFLIVGPGWNGDIPKDVIKVIRAPTNSINIYQRIYFRNTADILTVNKIQDQIKLTPFGKNAGSSSGLLIPDAAHYMKVDPNQAKDPQQVLSIANFYMGQNPPPDNDLTFTEYFASMGIGPALTLPKSEQALKNIGQGAVQADHAMSALALTGFPVKNGWQIPPVNIGERGGSNGVALQAMVQLRSVGINSSKEAVYYNAFTDSEAQTLRGNEAYKIVFRRDQIPPVKKDQYGFWSLTIYDRANARLIANSADKFSIRSADNLIFDKDGSFTLYVSPKPPADKALSVNWLPSDPAGEFILVLRAYLGEKAIIDGKYTPPPIVSINK